MRRVQVGLVVLALGLLTPAHAAHATESVELRRLSGATRYDTAAAISRATFPDPDVVYDVVVARGDDFADALAASHRATVEPPGAPILLTAPSELPAATIAELDRLTPSRITIMGGTAAVSADVERALRARYATAEVHRIAGQNRYETAERAAAAVPESSGAAFVVSGENFADAVAAGPPSFRLRMYVFPTPTDALHPATRDALTERGIRTVIILGGSAAVSTSVEAELRAMCHLPEGECLAVSRIAGSDRTETATQLADYFAQRLAEPFDHVNLARGDNFPDALAAGPHGGTEESPILFATDPHQLGDATRRWLEDHAPTVEEIDVLGDSSAVSDQVVAQARAAATT